MRKIPKSNGESSASGGGGGGGGGFLFPIPFVHSNRPGSPVPPKEPAPPVQATEDVINL